MSVADIAVAAPELRFPEFEGEWKNTTLGKESYCLDSKRIPLEQGERAKRSGEFPYYGASGIIDYIDDYLFDETLVLLGEDGANIINRSSPLAFLVTGKCWVNNHAHVYQAKGSPEFLATYLENLRYEKYNTGTAQPKLNGAECEKLKLCFPTLPEQKKIAAFFSGVDAKIAALNERQAGLERYKRGLMQALFSQTLRFTKPDGSAFPDWEEKRLGEVFTRVKRKNGEDNQNVLTISAQQGLVNQREYFTKSVAATDLTGYYLLNKGDFAYNKSYSKGYPMGAIKRLNKYDKGVVSTLYICFSTAQEATARFFEQYFEAGCLNREIQKIAQEGARNHGLLNMSVVEFFDDMAVPLPHPDEQQMIVDALSAMDAKITAVSDQVARMEAFKKGLLQQMFV